MATSKFGLVPVGGVIAWLKSYTSTPTLANQGRTEYVECGGQTLSDPQSVYNGQVIPNLNSSSASNHFFLRGNTVSGGTGGEDTSCTDGHKHSVSLSLSVTTLTIAYTTGATSTPIVTAVNVTGATTGVVNTNSAIPLYYDVVWLLRIK